MPSHLKKKPNSRRVWLPTGPGYQLCASFGLGLRAWLSCSLLGLARDIFFLNICDLDVKRLLAPKGVSLVYSGDPRNIDLRDAPKKSWCFPRSWAKFGGFQPDGGASNHGITGVLSIFWSLWTSTFIVKRRHEKMFQDVDWLFLQKQKTQWSIISILEYPSFFLWRLPLGLFLRFFQILTLKQEIQSHTKCEKNLRPIPPRWSFGHWSTIQ